MACTAARRRISYNRTKIHKATLRRVEVTPARVIVILPPPTSSRATATKNPTMMNTVNWSRMVKISPKVAVLEVTKERIEVL